MGLNASKVAGNKPRTPPLDPGSYPARLVQVVDFGLQPRSYKGEDKEPAQELMLTYEMSDEFLLDEDGEEQPDKPRWISETFPHFNLDSEKAKSTARYKALDPTLKFSGDWGSLLSTPIMVNLIQNPKADGKIYVNIAGTSPMREKDAAKLSGLVHKPRVFDLDDPDMKVFEQLPDWVKGRIKSNMEFRGSLLETRLGEATASTEETETKTANDNPY